MNILQFDPQHHRKEYAKAGYLHVKGGVSPEFLKFAHAQAEQLMADDENAMSRWHFKNKKRQFLFEFPDDNCLRGLLGGIAELAGLRPEGMTLCERHLKVYEDDADSMPAPHKDRLQSEATIGIPLVTSPETYLFAYPNDLLTINPFSSAAQWRKSLDADQLPEVALEGIEPVKLYVQPGDIVIFRGSSIYHDRANPANTVVLYLKVNGMRLDPAGEDPSTPQQRERSLEILNSFNDEQLLDCPVEVSPRLDRISRHYTRLGWTEVIQAFMWGEEEFTISEREFRIFKLADGKLTVREIMTRMGMPNAQYSDGAPMLRRLVKLGGIDLLEPITAAESHVTPEADAVRDATNVAAS